MTLDTTLKGVSGVYAICHRDSNSRYIGSSVDIARRWRDHRKFLEKKSHHSPHLQHAWDKYGEDSFYLCVLIRCEPFELQRYEQAFIDQCESRYNCALVAGTKRGVKHTAEARRKMSEARSGEIRGPLSPEHRNNISIAHKGRVISDEWRKKISKANTGKPSRNKGIPLSPETRAKLSVAHKGAKVPEERRIRISRTLTGRKFTEEHCKKIGLAQTGKKRGPMRQEWKDKIGDANRGKTHRPRSEETREKIRKALTGKKLSEETRAKMRVSHMGKSPSAESRAKVSATLKERNRKQQEQSELALGLVE